MEYDDSGSLIAKQLLKSFMEIRKAGWHERSIGGCKLSEFKILLCLKRKEETDSQGLMISELSQMLQVTSPTITQQVKELEGRGLVSRTVDPKDRRAFRIRLSEQGAAVIKEAYHDRMNFFRGMVEHLGEDQSKQLADLLHKVAAYFEVRVLEKDVTGASAGQSDVTNRNGDGGNA